MNAFSPVPVAGRPVERPVRLANGVTLSCVTHGDPGGTPLLLLHGYLDSWRSYEHLLPRLPRGTFAIVPSQRGHGASDKPASGYAPADFAADARLLLDALGIERAVVAGHSMGSYVAQRLALDAPARVAGLVLVGSFATVCGHRGLEEYHAAELAALRDPVPDAVAREFQLGCVARPLAPGFLDKVVGESRRVPARVWRATLRGLLDDDHSARLGEIRAPTLLVWGDADAFFDRAQQERLLAGIPGARLALYEGVGHAPNWEEPGRFAADLRAFLDAARTDEL